MHLRKDLPVFLFWGAKKKSDKSFMQRGPAVQYANAPKINSGSIKRILASLDLILQHILLSIFDNYPPVRCYDKAILFGVKKIMKLG